MRCSVSLNTFVFPRLNPGAILAGKMRIVLAYVVLRLGTMIEVTRTCDANHYPFSVPMRAEVEDAKLPPMALADVITGFYLMLFGVTGR